VSGHASFTGSDHDIRDHTGIEQKQPFVHYEKNQTQAIPNATVTRVYFDANDTKISDDLVFLNRSGIGDSDGNARFTVPVGYGGLYVINAWCTFDTSADTSGRYLLIRVNGTGYEAEQQVYNKNSQLRMSTSFIASLSAGDFVEMVVYQASGGVLDLVDRNGGTEPGTALKMTRVATGGAS